MINNNHIQNKFGMNTSSTASTSNNANNTNSNVNSNNSAINKDKEENKSITSTTTSASNVNPSIVDSKDSKDLSKDLPKDLKETKETKDSKEDDSKKDIEKESEPDTEEAEIYQIARKYNENRRMQEKLAEEIYTLEKDIKALRVQEKKERERMLKQLQNGILKTINSKKEKLKKVGKKLKELHIRK